MAPNVCLPGTWKKGMDSDRNDWRFQKGRHYNKQHFILLYFYYVSSCALSTWFRRYTLYFAKAYELKQEKSVVPSPYYRKAGTRLKKLPVCISWKQGSYRFITSLDRSLFWSIFGKETDNLFNDNKHVLHRFLSQWLVYFDL